MFIYLKCMRALNFLWKIMGKLYFSTHCQTLNYTFRFVCKLYATQFLITVIILLKPHYNSKNGLLFPIQLIIPLRNERKGSIGKSIRNEF